MMSRITSDDTPAPTPTPAAAAASLHCADCDSDGHLAADCPYALDVF
jgi:hypothetical protein